MKKINLGSGNDYRQGWINIDFDKSVNPDLIIDLSKKLPFKDNYVDYVLIQDVLEHLTKEDAKKLLKECLRVLKIGSKIQIRVPDVYQIFNKFKQDPEVLFRFLYGDTTKNGDLGTHKFGYTIESLNKLLKSIGFTLISCKNITTNIICFALKKNKEISIKNIAISLLDSGGKGGAEEFIYQLSSEFLNSVQSLTYFIFKDSLPQEIIANKKVLVINYPFRLDFIGNVKGFIKSLIYSPFYILISIYYLIRFKFNGGQLIIITGISDKFFLTPIAKLIKLSTIWIEFGPLAEVFKKNLYFSKFLYRIVKELPDTVICPTYNTKISLINDARISESKIKVIPCGIKIS